MNHHATAPTTPSRRQCQLREVLSPAPFLQLAVAMADGFREPAAGPSTTPVRKVNT